jgi:hypothetical protein
MSDNQWYPLKTKLTYIYCDENGHPCKMGDAFEIQDPYSSNPKLKIQGEDGAIVEKFKSEVAYLDIAD